MTSVVDPHRVPAVLCPLLPAVRARLGGGPGCVALVPCRGREQRRSRGGDPGRQPGRLRPDSDRHAPAGSRRAQIAPGTDADQGLPARRREPPDGARGAGVSRAERRHLGTGLGRHRRYVHAGRHRGRTVDVLPGRDTRRALTTPAASPQAAQRWILAEGASGVFSTFILVANPNATHDERARAVPEEHRRRRHLHRRRCRPTAATTYWPQVEYPAQLGSAEFSTVVESTRCRANRSSPSGRCTSTRRQRAAASRAAATTRSACPRPARTGTSPRASPAATRRPHSKRSCCSPTPMAPPTTATVTYQLDSGQAVTRDYALAPNQRLTVWVDQEGRTFDARLKAASFGMTVRATQPIVAERSMYWGTPSAADPTTPTFPWREGHATAGSPVLASRWAFAEGREGEDASVRAVQHVLPALQSRRPRRSTSGRRS